MTLFDILTKTHIREGQRYQVYQIDPETGEIVQQIYERTHDKHVGSLNYIKRTKQLQIFSVGCRNDFLIFEVIKEEDPNETEGRT